MTMLRPHRHPRKCQTSKSPMTFVTHTAGRPGGGAGRQPLCPQSGCRPVSDYTPAAADFPASRPKDIAIEWLAPATVTG
jgi:hypothetical protein